jgi:hypothetical protein
MGFNNSDLPGEIFLTPDQKEKDFYIKKVSELSNRYGDKLIELMDIFGYQSLQELSVKQLKDYYNKIRKDQEMGKILCIEDQIAEKLKGLCDYRANYIVKFSYGHVTVEEIDLNDIPNTNSKQPTIFDNEEK